MSKARPSAFQPNEHLKQARLLHNWTQADVAGYIGTYGYTVNRWECGRAHPSPYFRQKLCELFGTSALALGLMLAPQECAAPVAPPSAASELVFHWCVSNIRNAFFTGREEILEALHTCLCADRAVALTQSYALHGLGGVGKTQIALEYAYRYARDYRAVFWIDAETIESILASFGRIATHLQILERGETDQQLIAATVQHWLTTNEAWLLIWDNVEDPELLQRFLPPACQGAVLITTRHQALGTLTQSIDLSPMTPEEGMVFVLRRTKILRDPPIREHDSKPLPLEWEAAQELVRVMGGLPLALDQAGAYIEETGCGLAGYLQRYEQQRTQLLDRRGMSGRDHPHTVTATFVLAYQQVEQKNPLAADLLCLCSFLCAERIPEELFVADAIHLEVVADSSITRPFVTDLYQLDLAIATLRTFSLVQRQPETRTLSIHRLVQSILQDKMSEQERAQWQQRVVGLLHSHFPEVTRTTWEQCERLLPHVLLCETAVPDRSLNQGLADVLRKAADYLSWRSQYHLAESLYQRALRLQEQTFGSAHATVASALDGLARLSQVQGKYEQAESLYRQALHIREQTMGPEDLQITCSLNSLAVLASTRADYTQAERLHQRALHILERAHGPEHPDVAHPLNDLANLYSEQGKYEQAERCYLRALRIWENAFEFEHHDLAYPLYNLAGLYSEQGKEEQAERYYQRALRIWENALGSEHPLVAYPLNGLAALCVNQGKEEQAERYYQRALRIREQALGPANPGLVMSLGGLANLASRQKKYEQAEALYQRALAIQEQHLGRDHPETAQLLSGIAYLRMQQEKDEQAEAFYKRALCIQEQRLGQDHPERAKSLVGLARLYEKQRKEKQAEGLFREAWTIFEQRLGQSHPRTVQAKNDSSRLREQRKGVVPLLLDGSSFASAASQAMPLIVAVRGNTEQVAYTRKVSLREVTFTCSMCGQTVTQLHYPSGRIKYCSDSCRDLRRAQLYEQRVRKQRENRQAERGLMKHDLQR